MPLPPARFRNSRIILTTLLYALLLTLLACLGDQLHSPEHPHGRSAAAASGTFDASEPTERCHDSDAESAAFPQSSPRTAPTEATVDPSAPDTTPVPVTAVRRLPPSGGRSALPALCRWRI
ncbi:hypothetical protein [Streptomyces dysideae]|uniref:Uncharacterized protein n=1 Tax=Streptomyces dysideae TaxID=909626 RepID=A0A101UQL0_9ACTN|nr:hypothetical protein [Streptomyces dysideae]KUO14996.1 hypothetical protein AQJ91_43865 [Streptomyces dysideae]